MMNKTLLVWGGAGIFACAPWVAMASSSLAMQPDMPTIYGATGASTVSGLKIQPATATLPGSLSEVSRLTPSFSYRRFEVAQAQRPDSSIVTLQAPLISDYWVSVTRQPGNVLVFDGYVPDEETRTRLSEREGADVNFLRLGRGEPANYDAALELALEALGFLSEGRAALSGVDLTLSGSAATGEDFDAVRTLLQNELPAGITLANFDVRPPVAEDYAFTLQRGADGATVLSGMLPDPDLEQRLLSELGTTAQSEVSFASGAPDNFEASLDRAIAWLPLLETAEISFANDAWTVSGVPMSADAGSRIENAFAAEQLAQANWTLELDDSENEELSVSPYIWTAERLSDGSFLFTGNIPAETLRNYLAVHVGTRSTDLTRVSTGAPEGFAAAVRGAVDALMLLETGKASFDGTRWSLSGEAADTGAREESLALAELALGVEANIAAPQSEPEPELLVSAVPAQPENAAEVEEPRIDDTAQCSAQLAELTSHNAILFRSGAAIIADSAASELDAFAGALALCPNSAVHVEGHTDSDGEAERNLALSVARAEAVVDALVSRGVAPGRLYAIGYGESQPVADNGTAEGKLQNRRIVVSVTADAE